MSRFGREGEDIIGRWSEEKLDLLAKYIKAYSVIMNNQKTTNNPTGQAWLREYFYVDAFAGSVRPIAKEDERRYINGSPIRALETKPRFDRYWFIDISPQRIARLERLRAEFPECAIEIRQGNCNEVLRNEIIPLIPQFSRRRAFIFLDPYGLQVDWETVRLLAGTEACDIFVNFSVMGVTRLLPREQKPHPDAVEQLSKVMGNTNWIDAIYKERSGTQLDLFGNLEESLEYREPIRAQALAELYAEQLGVLFAHVSKPVLMKNSSNAALYSLCLASHKKVAVDITNSLKQLGR